MASPERRMLAGFLGAVLAVAAAMLLVFAAIGHAIDRPPAPGSKHIVFTGWGGIVEREVFTNLIKEFDRRNPDLDVEYRPVPRDYTTKLKLMFAAGTPPDVFYIPDGDFPGFAVNHRMVDLDPYIAASKVIKLADMWDSALARYRYDGRVLGQGPIYALPKDIGPTVMYVNTELVRAAGLAMPLPDKPMTWPEAEQFWKALTKDFDGDGTPDQWGTHGMPLESAVWSNGGEFLSPDGRRFVMADDSKALEGAQWTVDLQTRLHVAPMERQQQSIPVDTMFLSGRLASFMGGRWMVPQFRKADFHWDVLPIPVSPHTLKPDGWSGSVGLAISTACANKDAAWRLIEFLSGPEGQKVQALTGFQIPNQKWLASTDAFLQRDQNPAHAEVFIGAARYERANPSTHTPDGHWRDLLNDAMGRAARGEATAAAAIKQARDEIQKALDQGWK